MICHNVNAGPSEAEGKFVDVITCARTGAPMAYCFGGARPGPNSCVAGDAALMRALCDRLARLPTLPWIRGRLYLVEIDAAAGIAQTALEASLEGARMDATLLLPHAHGMHDWQISVERAYWTTLRLCARLGQIEGRGVRR